MGDIDAIRARAEVAEPKAGFVDEGFYRWATQAADDRDALLDALSAAEARTRELEATVQRVKAVADDVARYTRLDGSEVAVQLDTALWCSDV